MQETEHLEHFKIFVLLFLINNFLSAQKFPDAKVDSLLNNGISELINHDYVSAKNTFSFLNQNFPDIPFGKIYLAAIEIIKSYDFAEEFNEDFIEENLEEALRISDSLIEKNDKNIWNFYFKAITAGYYAYYSALNEKWLDSFSYGLISVKNFDKCIEKDPDFYEAYIAAGNYKYWKSDKMSFLNWLPVIDDERSEGIFLLEKSVNNFSYNKYLAINSLSWIYINEERIEDAINIVKRGLMEYPSCRILKWSLARAYEEIDKKKSIEIYYEILNSYPENQNGYNEITLKYKIARQYALLGENEKAIDLCNEILEKKLSKLMREKLAERLLKTEELKRELF